MSKQTRSYSLTDRLFSELDHALSTVYGRPGITGRPDPAAGVEPAALLTDEERRRSARLMRVNHAGEVAAQALYQGQGLTARDETVRGQMRRSAEEENDHLAWCQDRLQEMEGHRSYLDPFWYTGSFAIGALTGLLGDRWSLGFVKETERQVEGHLDGHLERLPSADTRSRAVLEQMKADEAGHAEAAQQAGGRDLPWPVRQIMRLTSKVMTRTAYWL